MLQFSRMGENEIVTRRKYRNRQKNIILKIMWGISTGGVNVLFCELYECEYCMCMFVERQLIQVFYLYILHSIKYRSVNIN